MNVDLAQRHTAPLFANLTEGELSHLLSTCNRWLVAPKMRLCSSGAPAAHLLLLRSGQTKYYRTTPHRTEEVLCWFVANDCFGLGAMHEQPDPNLGTAESVTACEFMVWNSVQARKAANEYPQFAINALTISLRGLVRMMQRHPGLFTETSPQRIVRALLDLCHRLGHVTPEGVMISATNEQLCTLANTDPTTVSRMISVWESEALLFKRGEMIRIDSPERLAIRVLD